MQQSEIDKQINREWADFLDLPYNKNVPDNLIEKFEKALMIVPPQAHQINFNKVKAIINKQPEELSNTDINDVIKLIYNTPLQALYDDLYEAIPEQIKLERFVLKFNQNLAEQQEKLNQKKITLASLTNGVIPSNGMRIIPN